MDVFHVATDPAEGTEQPRKVGIQATGCRAVEEWLRTEVGEAYDPLAADPS